jgi:hypothetical protein
VFFLFLSLRLKYWFREDFELRDWEGKDSQEAREAMKKRLEDMTKIDERGRRKNLGMSSKSRLFEGERSGEDK